jgi:hypothetical protein
MAQDSIADYLSHQKPCLPRRPLVNGHPASVMILEQMDALAAHECSQGTQE